mmetsp:Transcript_38639/g.83950  ORF Transcript_38639/g.83950 Transcript_38639/m.83950 type:complete len:212 (-) Transcript_38639:155-790(-)
MKSSAALSLLAVACYSQAAQVSAFGGIQRTSRLSSTSHVTTRPTRPTRSSTRPTPTALYLEDHIADLIDSELVRVGKLKEWEREWHEKNKPFIEPKTNAEAVDSLLSSTTASDDGVDRINPMMLKRDQRMAEKDPQKYCADRCVATGNCEVYEDMFEMSPAQVMEFCNDCVLAEDDDAECPIPDSMYGEDDVSDLRTDVSGGGGSGGELRP